MVGFEAFKYASHSQNELPSFRDTRLLSGSDLECSIYDIVTMGFLFTFDVVKANIANISSHLGFSEMIIKLEQLTKNFQIVRISAAFTVERFTADRKAAVGVRDCQPTFLEVRDDTLWEIDHSTERPLCWLPILWRKAFHRGCMIWSGPILIFGLRSGDFGALSIESLRRDCRSVKRARTEA